MKNSSIAGVNGPNGLPIVLRVSGLVLLAETILLLLGVQGVRAQALRAAPFFQEDGAARVAAAATPLAAALRHARPLTIDVPALRAALAAAQLETPAGAAPRGGGAGGAAPLVLALPLPDGTTGRFQVTEAPVMAPELAAQFPEIRTYAGVGVDDASASVRLDVTPAGFHAQVLAADGQSFYIDPVRRNDAAHYLSFYRKDMDRAAAGPAMTCGFAPTAAELEASAARTAAARSGVAGRALSTGPQLRTYRLAVAATGEYTTFHGGTVALGQAAIVTTVNRVVGVYEKELAVRLVLVANNSSLVYTNAGSDPYTNSSSDLAANQTTINAVIGAAFYDIGHLVGTGGGGVAGLGVVCGTSKAQGLTGSSSPAGDAFDIDYVAHEMGHQFAGNHPFNGNAGSCAGGNRNASTAWEPGSGSTIMAYAGICGTANDLQPNSDPIFHTGSYQEMRAFISANACATTTATGNTAPVVTGPANKTLPINTPFKLTATATDAENDPLTYLWEELDLGPQQSPTDPQVANVNVPLFRSFVPGPSGTRYFPRLSDLVSNTTVIGERLPTVTRTLTFRCTARDAHSGPAGVIGGVDYSALVTLPVTSAAGPFLVTAPNTAVSWPGASARTVTWAVAGTTAAPVSCATVNIRLSLDGGLTYPTLLAANEPNDGSALVVAPTFASAQTQARILVEAADNYFFDISNVNFTITPPVAGPTISSFTPTGGLAGTVVVLTGFNFAGTTAVTFNGTAAASFAVNSATQITATVAAGTSTGPITVAAPTGTGISATPFVVGAPPVVTSFAPATGAVGATVVVTGTGFLSASQVRFNGTFAPGFVVNSATQITANVPAGATTGPVSVTTPVATGTSAASFTVIDAPVVTSFAPAAGPAGTVVVVSGNFFLNATQVTFNGVAAGGFVVSSATQLTVTVPAGATTGPIAVTGPGGTGTSAASFTVTNDLCGQAIALVCGQAVTGSTVGATATGDPTGTCGVSVDGGGVFYTVLGTGGSITVSTCSAGTDFDTKLFVYSGSCSTYTCVGGNDDDATCSGNGTTSTVTFSSVPGTVYRVFVGGFGSDAGTFVLSVTCAAPPVPTVTGLSPSSELSGRPVSITGTNFVAGTAVRFGGVAASSVVVNSPTSLTATVPAGAAVGSSAVVVTANGIPSASAPAFSVLKVYDAATAGACLSTAPYAATGDGQWRYLLAPSGEVVAALQDTRAALGTVTAQFLLAGAAGPVRQDGGGRKYLDRNFRLTATNPTFTGSSVAVRFYGLTSEQARLQAADPAATLAQLKATQYSGANEDCDLGNNAAGGQRRTLPAPASTPGGGAPWFVAEVSVPDHFSEFYLSGSSAPLPVELTEFAAERRGPAVLLTWRTASEKNSDRFEVERSADGRVFGRVGTVGAAGNSTGPLAYTWLDADLPLGPRVWYYRLRQVDLDGAAAYSPVRAVLLEASAGRLALFPNPTAAAATLTGAGPGAVVRVLDVLGRVVLTTAADATGTAVLRWPAPALAAGVYLVRAGQSSIRLSVEP